MHKFKIFNSIEKILKDITVILPAAGRNTRFSESFSKLQYNFTPEKTVLETTLDCFYCPNSFAKFSKIIVVFSKEEMSKNIFSSEQEYLFNIQTIEGGAERMFSVSQALEYVSTPWVLIHDAARPLLQFKDLKKIILERGSLQGDGALLATPVRDSLKRSEPIKPDNIQKTFKVHALIDRKNLWQSLTPQIFPTKRLKTAMKQAFLNKNIFGDEAELIFSNGGTPKIVFGQWSNLKLTYFEDLQVMQALYKYLNTIDIVS